ncbi:polyketide biosynthesis enoyl-CoA hydratase PksH [Streptomyces sp. 1114.5]|uniref:enoyl-CoA hydratase-related protein n=1 Tax=unclassified Streptomyces TaxID=2593676 RepID=UPI000BD23E8A|nr:MULTISPECIES: enoyl-CoA hydratase-related protein [unclassified Streptomyces]RKT17058.1 polyketide biosynthesis enoyl-CoA hydratase PksH [Streptomyces sp. 1114.5]SOB83269.1 polyketide biosynthesis enoyl-CoA hydratase PksH [Streptomyces sp. 1331.2]
MDGTPDLTAATEPGYRTLVVTRRREMLRVVINRPEYGNSINGVLMEELHAVLDRAEADPALRMVVLEGVGPVFCSGMDFTAAAGSNRAGDELAVRGGEVFYGLLKRFTTSPRIIVSVVDGRVTGGGVGIVAASDFVYATERSTFALPEALWGLLPCCVMPFLVRRAGFQPAYSMTMSTLPVTAARAAQVNLVDELLADPEPTLRRLAARLGKLDDRVIADGKRYFERMWLPAEELERTAVTEFARLMSSPVVQHRIANFASHQQMPWENR